MEKGKRTYERYMFEYVELGVRLADVYPFFPYTLEFLSRVEIHVDDIYRYS